MKNAICLDLPGYSETITIKLDQASSKDLLVEKNIFSSLASVTQANSTASQLL